LLQDYGCFRYALLIGSRIQLQGEFVQFWYRTRTLSSGSLDAVD
jgi:hypothetical protein